jgi:hypothetical protein
VNACKLSDSADMPFLSSWRQNVTSRAAVRNDRVAPPCGISTAILTLDYWIFEYAYPRSSKPIPPEIRTPLHMLLLELSVIFTYITWRMSDVAFGRARGLGGWFLPVTLIAIFATCGWMLVLGRGH